MNSADKVILISIPPPWRECHLGFPCFPGFFIFIGKWRPPNLSGISISATKTPNLFGKVHFHEEYNYQSKEQGRLAWCNSFHLSSDLATFTISLISAALWVLPKKRQLDAWVADSVYDIMGLNTSFCLFGICQKNQQKLVVIWGIV